MADFDVVIVGAGFAGANLALKLGNEGKSVLLLDAGPGIERSREDYMENFFLNTFKSPSSPYPPNDNAMDPSKTNAARATVQDLVLSWQEDGMGDYYYNNANSYLTYTADSPLRFASTYERLAGGTGNHWMGTSLRMSPNDFKLRSLYGHGRDWPWSYDELMPFYAEAEDAIGVSANVEDQAITGVHFEPGREYPMQALPESYSDGIIRSRVDGAVLTSDNATPAEVTVTPAGRNAQPYQGRRVCHGNTNCTPICPIQAKYDAQFALSLAMDTGNVTLKPKCVVDYLTADSPKGDITGVHYLEYVDTSVPANGGETAEGFVTANTYVVAAHSIEAAKLLLLSPSRNGGVVIANSSDQVGRNLMDHPTYLAWGLSDESHRLYQFRGPLSTSGIENLRDGAFRANRAAWRIELGNAAWNWPANDPYTSGQDYIYGVNNGGTNTGDEVLGNSQYVDQLNDILTRQFRIGFLVEQDAEPTNRIVLSGQYQDNLGIPRPEIYYDLSNYVKDGFTSAREASERFMSNMGAVEYTQTFYNSTYFRWIPARNGHPLGDTYNYNGAGHICGTHIMGSDPADSVVDRFQRSHDHQNLFLVGCGSMPSVGAENPTLTMLALALASAEEILRG